MLINLFVLAVVNGLLGLTVLGVIVGMAFLPAGRVLFAPCGWMLDSYRFLCEVSLKIPGAQRITGNLRICGSFGITWGLECFFWRSMPVHAEMKSIKTAGKRQICV